MKRLFKISKNNLRKIRHKRIRAKMFGTAELPRLSVFRSARAMTAQIIDDAKGHTVCGVNSTEIKVVKKVEGRQSKESTSFLLGKLLAEKAIKQGIKKIIFDRGGYNYHGRVKALAEGAREGGLEF